VKGSSSILRGDIESLGYHFTRWICENPLFFEIVLLVKMAESEENLMWRPLSVHFSTKFINRITHDEVLSSIITFIDKKDIKSIQITESECIITLSSAEIKSKVILHGLRIQNRYIYITDVEKSSQA
jgi:hypothetical protein